MKRWNKLGPVLVLAFVCMSGAVSADQGDARLAPLFEQLREAGSPEVSRPFEQAIWEIWLESGDPRIDQMMERGLKRMALSQLAEAIVVFTEVIKLAPDFAEAWNKRATAFYLAQDLKASVADIRKTLDLEPRHFGALSGMGLILIRREDPTGALGAFERVLEIHPNAQGAKQQVEWLRHAIRSRAV